MHPILVANWKLHPTTRAEARSLFHSTEEKVDVEKARVIVCPPFLYIPLCVTDATSISIGGQGCAPYQKGALTGAISAAQLADTGCNYVIVGHSERRDMFQEEDLLIEKRVQHACSSGLTPIICVGESIDERERGVTQQILRDQLTRAINGISMDDARRTIIAYEPLWAIGSGNNCSPEEAAVQRDNVRDILTDVIDEEARIPVLYGGSVDSSNAREYIEAGMDGLLVGGASLDPAEFARVISAAE